MTNPISAVCKNNHGTVYGVNVRVINIKGRLYFRCKKCQQEKDRQYSQAFRDRQKLLTAKKETT